MDMLQSGMKIVFFGVGHAIILNPVQRKGGWTMIKPADSLGYRPMAHSGAPEPIDCGYFGLDPQIAKALGKKSHLGYLAESCTWASETSDCGYFAVNRKIAIALRRLARR